MLQCYALQQFLAHKGYKVEVIDYRPEYLRKEYELFNRLRIADSSIFRILKNIIRDLWLLPFWLRRHRAFGRFSKEELCLSGKVSGKDIPDDYDVYVVGSDQIWNPLITNGYDDVYFCRFKFEKGKRRYMSYAASMEVAALGKEEASSLSLLLNGFDAISVREDILVDMLQPYTKCKIEQVLDPTLLLDVAVWDRIVIRPRDRQKYVFVYQVRENEHTMRVAQSVADELQAKVVTVVPYFCKKSFGMQTPGEFVGLIKYAECVVTTSFHGTAFSVIFNKPFYTLLLKSGSDTRSSSLLHSIGLGNRLVALDEVPRFSGIDYTAANEALLRMREQSECFVENSLK